MFDKKEIVSERSNGSTKSETAAEQQIIVRPFATSVKIKLAGEEFDIKPPSYHVSKIIRQFRHEHSKKISRERDNADAIMKRLDDATKKINSPDKRRKQTQDGTEGIDVLLNVVDEVHEQAWKISDMGDRDMFRLVQLIVLDSKSKDWRRKHESFPPDDVLETAISYDKLYYDCDLVELQVLLDVYDQMNKPEIPRKNFYRLGTLV